MNLNNNILYGKHERLIKLKTETYEKIYRRCINQIKLASEAGELVCFFEIPKSIFENGYQIVNTETCANYIMHKLVKANNNIHAYFIEPNLIFIDWRK
jgi:hypothetical protein